MAYPNLVAEVIFKGIQMGQTVVNRFVYGYDTFQSGASSVVLADAMYSIWDTLWKPAVSNQFFMASVQATIYQIPTSGNKPPYIRPINAFGSNINTEPLPPYVTVRFIKGVDNATKEPPTVVDFRNGSTRISGIPEGYINNGVLTASGLGLLNPLSEALEAVTVDFGSGNIELYSLVDRFQKGGNNPVVKVAEWSVAYKSGSQNSRKP